MNIADLRKDYKLASLAKDDANPDPLKQFDRWLEEAIKADMPEPTAMSLATVAEGEDGVWQPSSRIVLLKGRDETGFVFYTNYESRKGRELAGNEHAALLFHWVELERQVRIEGRVEKIDPAESDAYYKTRPLTSRQGAWASPQSREIPSRTWLMARVAEAVAAHPFDPPRPPHWGGYRVVPHALEFWQGRRSRLHDRIKYRRVDGQWERGRLAP
ncbi:MAG: pyridoxamine 5'-phosphate oxidase [Betaproteobacteria bacterium]|nr:pyridoxamine 5'-phosphate oxidase [Betaproteobacteria bacterium]